MKANERQVADGRLDRLYMKAMRCPYCHSKIEKGVAVCPNCGITKEQIYHANLVMNKRRKKGEPRVKRQKPQIIMSKIRPASIPFWKVAIGGMFGFLGVHCFVTKRWWRGAFILACFLAYIICFCVFPTANATTGAAAHWLRAAFESKTYLFPPDLLGITALVMWIWDWFAILFGKFKYPVVIEATAEAVAKENA